MGGHAGGAIASKTAVDCIIEYFNNHEGENPIQAIHESIKFANTQIFARAQVERELFGMGTTCVVLLIQKDGKAYFGHVGDSRIYLMTGGNLIRMTKDHSFVQMLIDNGEITEKDAEKHPNRNQILKALGIDEHVKPEICQEPVCPAKGDIFLLCSDGLSGMTSERDMLQVLKQEKKSGFVEKLIQLALNGGGKDNITAIAIEIENSPFAKTQYKLYHNSHDKNTQGPQKKSGIFIKKSWVFVATAILITMMIVGGSIYFFTKEATPEKIETVSPKKPATTISENPTSKTDSTKNQDLP
jgi:serine/threonine protein phosphatase PrpC